MPTVRQPHPTLQSDAASARSTSFVLHRHKIFATMLLCIVSLLLLSLAGQIAKYKFGYPTGLGLISLFYVDDENNLPSWFQSIAYLFAALLLALIATPLWRGDEPWARHWSALSAIFLFLSLDEMGSLHERTIEPLQRLIGTPTGMWAPTWVVLGIALVAVLGLAYLRFFLHLRWRERAHVMLALLLLVGGAVGVEMANSSLELGPEIQRKQTFQYAVMAHVEEGFEMLGLLVFIDFLLARLVRAPMLRVRVES
ncbi:MAG: hypothetical protein K0S54_2462 [Alphaproteobacteria bacterium]|jgi:hypothetical protein|nr:hypothetical protein [Alphaproteobacteria bacterium]